MTDQGSRTPLDFALRYAALGFSVLPLHSVHDGRCSCGKRDCASVGKHPRTAHGAYDASTDEATIRAWWGQWPDANVGLALAGLVVIDTDPRNGGSLQAIPGALPETCHARTGSGGSHHLMRVQNGTKYAGSLGPGLDLKSGAGSYIVVAPSVHASGDSYAWNVAPWDQQPAPAPAWLPVKGTSAAELIPHLATVDQEALAARLKAVQSDPELTALQQGEPLPWMRDTTRSGFDFAMAHVLARLGFTDAEIGSILLNFPHGKAAGRQDAERYVGDILRKVRAPKEPPPPISPTADCHFDAKRLTLAALRTPIAPREFVIEPLLPKGVLTEFSGAHGISKSTLALGMVVAVATGRSWSGLPTTGGKVVFASREDAHEEILRRVQAWIASIAPSDRPEVEQALCENLILLGRDETAGLMLTTKSFGACSVRREAVDLIVERCQGAALIVLETAARLHGGDELNEDLAQLAEAFEQVASRTNAAVILIRHVSKAAARDKAVDSYAGRGGGALSDAARSVLVLVQLSPEQARDQGITLDGLAATIKSPVIALHHAKASYSAPHEPLFFVRLPGPVLRQVAAPDPDEVFGERLLTYLRRQGEPLSLRNLQKACGSHRVPQRMVERTLSSLERTKQVRSIQVDKRGGYVVWEAAS